VTTDSVQNTCIINQAMDSLPSESILTDTSDNQTSSAVGVITQKSLEDSVDGLSGIVQVSDTNLQSTSVTELGQHQKPNDELQSLNEMLIKVLTKDKAPATEQSQPAAALPVEPLVNAVEKIAQIQPQLVQQVQLMTTPIQTPLDQLQQQVVAVPSVVTDVPVLSRRCSTEVKDTGTNTLPTSKKTTIDEQQPNIENKLHVVNTDTSLLDDKEDKNARSIISNESLQNEQITNTMSVNKTQVLKNYFFHLLRIHLVPGK
jgi:hypothetical protein